MMPQADLSALRRVGARHGIIKTHRGLRRLSRSPIDVLEAAVLVCAGTAAWFIAMPAVGYAWRQMVEIGARWLGMRGVVSSGGAMIPTFAGGLLPRLRMEEASPSPTTMVVVSLMTIAVLVVSTRLPTRMLPLAYWLRVLAVVELTAVAYFAFSDSQRVPYVADATLATGAVIIGMVPAVLGLTLYLFDSSLIRGALVTAATMLHLIVLLPLQYLLQLSLIDASSRLLAPVCFLALGPALDVMVLVAFYGWAMGRDPRRLKPHPADVL